MAFDFNDGRVVTSYATIPGHIVSRPGVMDYVMKLSMREILPRMDGAKCLRCRPISREQFLLSAGAADQED